MLRPCSNSRLALLLPRIDRAVLNRLLMSGEVPRRSRFCLDGGTAHVVRCRHPDIRLPEGLVAGTGVGVAGDQVGIDIASAARVGEVELALE